MKTEKGHRALGQVLCRGASQFISLCLQPLVSIDQRKGRCPKGPNSGRRGICRENWDPDKGWLLLLGKKAPYT